MACSRLTALLVLASLLRFPSCLASPPSLQPANSTVPPNTLTRRLGTLLTSTSPITFSSSPAPGGELVDEAQALAFAVYGKVLFLSHIITPDIPDAAIEHALHYANDDT